MWVRASRARWTTFQRQYLSKVLDPMMKLVSCCSLAPPADTVEEQLFDTLNKTSLVWTLRKHKVSSVYEITFLLFLNKLLQNVHFGVIRGIVLQTAWWRHRLFTFSTCSPCDPGIRKWTLTVAWCLLRGKSEDAQTLSVSIFLTSTASLISYWTNQRIFTLKQNLSEFNWNRVELPAGLPRMTVNDYWWFSGLIF